MIRHVIVSFVLLACAGVTRAEWPQAKSDLKPDPAVRFGELPNGMRYAIKRNTLPAGQVAIRLRIHTGALQETDAQQGLAHFLEHMAFHGSAKVPSGEVEKSLERLGLKFGADTNAYTNSAETVYRFDLARNDDVSLDTGLLLMRETCDALTLDAKLFDTERGVVLSEMRLGDNPNFHMTKAQLSFLLPEMLVPRRLAIGQAEVIQNAPLSQVRSFYQTWYRPERATLLVAGDIDVDAMEKRIVAQFKDWKAQAPAAHAPDLGKPAKRGMAAATFAEAGVSPSTAIVWIRPLPDTTDTRARRKAHLIEGLGMSILNRRLQQAAAAADRKFTSAGAAVQRSEVLVEMVSLNIGHEAGGWRAALQAAEQLRRQVVEQGVQQAELDREISSLRAVVETSAKSMKTIPTTGIVGGLLSSVVGNEVFLGPDNVLALVEGILKEGITVAAVNDALRKTFAGAAPLAFVSSPTPVEGGDKAVLAALTEAEGAPVEAAAVFKAETWPYTDFGKPGTVVKKTRIEDLDITDIRFANGVLLNFKPTKFIAEQVLVSVAVGNGRLDWPANQAGVQWAINSSAFLAGGTGKLSRQALQRALTGKILNDGFGANDSGYNLSGQTRPADLDTQLQLLAAYVTDPGFRPEALEQMRAWMLTYLPQLEATPGGVFGSRIGQLLHNGDRRWGMPTPEEVKSVRNEELKAFLQPALAGGAIRISVVGDVSLERVIETVAATFGALPARPPEPKQAQAGEVGLPKPSAVPVILEHQGKPEQGMVAAVWPATDAFASVKVQTEEDLLSTIVQHRLKEILREQAGASYSVNVNYAGDHDFPGYGYLTASADIPPAKSALFFESLRKISADLRQAPPTVDELDRARNPMLANMKQSREFNTYWLPMLRALRTDPNVLALIRESLSIVQTITPVDVQTAAKTFLIDDKVWKVVVQAAAKQ